MRPWLHLFIFVLFFHSSWRSETKKRKDKLASSSSIGIYMAQIPICLPTRNQEKLWLAGHHKIAEKDTLYFYLQKLVNQYISILLYVNKIILFSSPMALRRTLRIIAQYFKEDHSSKMIINPKSLPGDQTYIYGIQIGIQLSSSHSRM